MLPRAARRRGAPIGWEEPKRGVDGGGVPVCVCVCERESEYVCVCARVRVGGVTW